MGWCYTVSTTWQLSTADSGLLDLLTSVTASSCHNTVKTQNNCLRLLRGSVVCKIETDGDESTFADVSK